MNKRGLNSPDMRRFRCRRASTRSPRTRSAIASSACSRSTVTTRPISRGRTPSTGSSPTSTSPSAGSSRSPTRSTFRCPRNEASGIPRTACRAHPHRPEAHRDHFNPRGRVSPSTATDAFGRTGRSGSGSTSPRASPCISWRSTAGPWSIRASIAEMVVPYADHRQFGTGRTTSIRASTCSATPTRWNSSSVPRRHHVLRRHHRRRAGRPQGDEERDLLARRGLRRAVEAHRHVQRHGRGPTFSDMVMFFCSSCTGSVRLCWTRPWLRGSSCASNSR